MEDPQKMTATIMAAVQNCGVRAIVSKGWSKLGQEVENENENVLFIDDCPHGKRYINIMILELTNIDRMAIQTCFGGYTSWWSRNNGVWITQWSSYSNRTIFWRVCREFSCIKLLH